MVDEKSLKTGTTTLAVVCKDCVVVIADKRATAGNWIAERDVEKVFVLQDMALTISGTVSDAQQLIKILDAELRLSYLRSGRKMNVKETANLIGGINYSGVRTPAPSIVHFLLAGYMDYPVVYNLSVDGCVFEKRTYTASGSGSIFILGVLDNDYKENMSEKEGIELGLKAMKTAMKHDSATGNGCDIYVVKKSGVSKVMTKWVNNSLE